MKIFTNTSPNMHIPNIYGCNEYMYKSMYETVNKNLLKKKNLEKL